MNTCKQHENKCDFAILVLVMLNMGLVILVIVCYCFNVKPSSNGRSEESQDLYYLLSNNLTIAAADITEDNLGIDETNICQQLTL